MPAPPIDPIEAEFAKLGWTTPLPNETTGSASRVDPIEAEFIKLGWTNFAPAFDSTPSEPEVPKRDTGILGQFYGSLVRGVTDTVAALPESLGTVAYNLERKYGTFGELEEGETLEEYSGLVKLGSGIRKFGRAITPDESRQYADSFWVTDVPSGIGTVFGFIVGTKGVGGGIKALGGGSAGATARATARVEGAAAARTAAGKKALSEGAKKRAIARGAAYDARTLAHAATAATGASVQSVEGWNDAYATLMAKANAEGRDFLNDSELDQAWSAFKWNAPAGMIEGLGAEGIALKLFKNLDKGTKGAFSRGWIHLFKEAGKGAAREAGQESVQTAWMNMVAAEIAKYDDNRKLLDGVARAGGAGGVIGAIFGGVMGSVNRKAAQQQRIASLIDIRERLLKSGNKETAAEVNNKIQAEMLSLEENIDAEAARQLIIDATEEWKKEQKLISEENYKTYVNLQTDDWIENPDGTVTVPAGDGWSYQTITPTTKEELYGPMQREYEQIEVLEENEALKIKQENLERKYEKAISKIEKQEEEGTSKDIKKAEEQADKIQKELEAIEEELEKNPMVKVKVNVPKPLAKEGFQFAVNSPEGTAQFGPFNKEVDAIAFIKEQQDYVDDFESRIAELEDSEVEAIVAQIEAAEEESKLREEESVRQTGMTLEERLEFLEKQKEQAKEDPTSRDAAVRLIGLSENELSNYRGGDIVSIGGQTKGRVEKYEVVSETDSVFDKIELKEGQEYIRSLRTGEKSIVDSAETTLMMWQNKDGMYFLGKELMPIAEVAETGLDASYTPPINYRWTPEAIELGKSEIYGFVDPSGGMKVEVDIVPEDGMTITVNDVRNAKARDNRRVKQWQAQAESMKFFPKFGEKGLGVSETIDNAALDVLNKLNSPEAKKARGGMDMKIETVLRIRELINAEIDYMNTKASQEASKKNKILSQKEKEKSKKRQQELADRLSDINEIRYFLGKPPIESKEIDVSNVSVPESRRKKAKRKPKIKGKITSQEVMDAHDYLAKSISGGEAIGAEVEAKTKKATRTGETVTLKIGDRETPDAKVIVGRYAGFTYRAYEVKKNDGSTEIYYHNVQLDHEWTSEGEALGRMTNDRAGLFVIEEEDGGVIGTFDNPANKNEAELALKESKSKKFRIAYVTRGRVKLGKATRAEKIAELHRESGEIVSRANVVTGFEDSNGVTTLMTLRSGASWDGTGLADQIAAERERRAREQELAKEEKEREAARRRAEILRKRGGEDVSVETGKSNWGKANVAMAEAFLDEAIGQVITGGRFNGIEFDGVVLAKPQMKHTKAGDAVWVRPDDPSRIYINPIALQKYFKVEEGKLVPLEKNGRAVDSVVNEEMSHLLDLQVINYLIKSGNAPRGIKDPITYLRSIYNQLSSAQVELIVRDYMGQSKTVSWREAEIDAESTRHALKPSKLGDVDAKGLRGSDRAGGALSEDAIAMEALRMIRSGNASFLLETDDTAKTSTIFSKLWQAGRELLGPKISADKKTPALKAYMNLTEKFLVVRRDSDGKEHSSPIGIFMSAEAPMKMYYVNSATDTDEEGKPTKVWFNATPQGKKDALEFAKAEEKKRPKNHRITETETIEVGGKEINKLEKVRVKGGDVRYIRGGYDESVKGDRDRFNDTKRKHRLLAKLQEYDFINFPPSAAVKSDIDKENEKIVGVQKITNWGSYAMWKASLEANKVWGIDAKGGEELRRYVPKNLPEGLSAAEIAARTITHGAGEIDSHAQDWYEMHILQKVHDALVPQWSISPVYFDGVSPAKSKKRIIRQYDDEGKNIAIEKATDILRQKIAEYAADQQKGMASVSKGKNPERARFIEGFDIEGKGQHGNVTRYKAEMRDGKIVITKGRMSNRQMINFVKKNMVKESSMTPRKINNEVYYEIESAGLKFDSEADAASWVKDNKADLVDDPVISKVEIEGGLIYPIKIATVKEDSASVRLASEYSKGFMEYWHSLKRNGSWRRSIKGVSEDGEQSPESEFYDDAEIIKAAIELNQMTNPSEIHHETAKDRYDRYLQVVYEIESAGLHVPKKVFDSEADAASWVKDNRADLVDDPVVRKVEVEGGQVKELVEEEREGFDVTERRIPLKHRVEETPEIGRPWRSQTRGKPAPELEGEYRKPLPSEAQEVKVPLKPKLVEETTKQYQWQVVNINKKIPNIEKLTLSTLEQYIVRKTVNQHGVNLLTVDQIKDDLEFALENKGAVAESLTKEYVNLLYKDPESKKQRISRAVLIDAQKSGFKKIENVLRIASDGNMPTYGANMHEQSDSAETIAQNPTTSSDTTTSNSPVVDRDGKLAWDWRNPAKWSVTDTLRKAGFTELAEAIDNYYRNKDFIQGEIMNGFRVIKEGGVELVGGVDERGVKREGMFFATAEQGQAWADRNGWNLNKALFVNHEGYGTKQVQSARFQVEEYWRLHETSGTEGQVEENKAIANYFLENKASKPARDIIKWQRSTGRTTGYMLDKENVQVNDGGKWRDIENLYDEHFPRVFSQRTWEIINNPIDNQEEFSKMCEAMVDAGISKNKWKAELKLQEYISGINDFTETGDFFANIEKARGFKLPNEFYDYSMDAYFTYVRRFSDRMAQIQSFSQGKKGNKTMWDKVLRIVKGKGNKDYIENIRKSITRTYGKDDPVFGFLSRVGIPAAAVTMLSGPLTSIRNSAFALRANAESFGLFETLTASTKLLFDSATTNINSIRKGKGTTDEAMAEAANLNMLREDFVTGQMYASASDDIRTGKEAKYHKGMSHVQKYALWMMRVTENFNRSITATMALQHLRKTRELWATNPEGTNTAKHMAILTRLGYGQERLSKLMEADKDGHWNPDQKALKEYVMDMTNEKQYGYNIRQHPLWMDSAGFRLLFQFQKWGFQRTRDFAKNVVAPFLVGTKVTMPDGTVKNVRDGKMLYRNVFLMMGMGELYATILAGIFKDREREELVVPMSEKDESIMLGASERIARNLIYDGGFGILGDYINWLNPLDTRPRKWKNPLPTNPPTWALVTESQDTVRDIYHILSKDTDTNAKSEAIVESLRNFTMKWQLPKTVFEGANFTAQRWLGIESYNLAVQDSRKDVRLVRTAARDFAKMNGYEDGRVWSGGRAVMTEKRFLYGELNEALIVGDYVRARMIRDRIVGDKKGKEKRAVLSAIKASVRAKQPILLDGKQPDSKVQREFLRWVSKELPEYEVRIDRVHDTYWKAARRAGLK